MSKSSKKSVKSGVRFNYLNEEGFLCLGLFLERKLGRLNYVITLYESNNSCHIEISSNFKCCLLSGMVIETIQDCIKRTSKDCGTYFCYDFDFRNGKPVVHISCCKDCNLPF